MTKTWKKSLITVFLTLLFSALFCCFTACGPNEGDDGTVNYTVTVKTDDGAAASDVSVKIKKGGISYEPVNTDAEGKAVFELAPDDYTVTLSNLPAHYSVPDDADLTLSAAKHDLTITLAEDFSYKIYLVNLDGTPYYADGVYVGICTPSGNCLQPQELEAGGVVRYAATRGDYLVQISRLPNTVTFDRDETDIGHENYYTGGQLSATETEITITIYPVPVVNDIADATPMTSAQKAAYAAANSQYTADEALTAYRFTKTLVKNETAYYSFTPTISGDYKIYKDSSATYLHGSKLQLGSKGNGVYYALTLEAGVKEYLNVSNNGDEAITFDFVIEFPAASYTKITGAGTVDVTISKASANAVVELAPTSGASYKLSVLGTQQTSIIESISTYAAENATHAAASYKANPEISVKFTEDLMGGSFIFSISTKTAANFQIKVEKIADLTNKTTVLETQETLSAFADETEKSLTALPYGSTLYYDEANGYYRLNDANGPVVVVMLTNKSERSKLGGGLIYLEESNERLSGKPYLIDVTSDADKADLTKGNSYNDYRTLLRGFGDYTFKPNNQGGFDYVKPAISAQNIYYAKYVNSDGVYPLTKELEAFLKGFAKNYADEITGATEGNEWQFACYYYTSATTPVEKDVIVGEYEQASPRGKITLTVNASGTFVISENGNGITGSWIKNNDGTYTFTTDSDDPFWIIPYAVTRDAATSALTFIDPDNDVEPAYEFEVVAE